MKEMQEGFSRFYKKAALITVVRAETAVYVVDKFAASGPAIEFHPDFPEHPTWASKTVPNKDQENDARVYIKALQDFLENVGELNQEHIDHINKRIREWSKKVRMHRLVKLLPFPDQYRLSSC
jgi:hypothetical protein